MLPKNTRIGLLAPIIWPIPPKSYGAWERVVTNLATGLVKLGYKNITLFATKQARVKGVKVVSIIDKPLSQVEIPGKRAFEFLHIAHGLKQASKSVDIIHNHLNYHPLLFSQFIDRPIVTTMHGSGIEPESKIGYSHYRRLPFVSISNFERKFIPHLNYVATVYNGIDMETFTFNPRKGKYLVNTGRIHPTKGVHNAVKLALAVKTPLYLAGPVEKEAEGYFREKIKPFIDGKRIIYLGNLPQPRINKLVGNALAFVGLIEWQEPFGLSVAEALSCGTPVIATPRGAHPELIKDGVNGLLVNSVREAIGRFDEIKLIDRSVCRQTAEKLFSMETMAKGYLAAYQLVLKK